MPLVDITNASYKMMEPVEEAIKKEKQKLKILRSKASKVWKLKKNKKSTTADITIGDVNMVKTPPSIVVVVV